MHVSQAIKHQLAVLICLVLFAHFCSLFYTNFQIAGSFNSTSDYIFHLKKINGNCDGIARDCAWYPSFFHTLFIGQGEPAYFFGSMFLLFMLFPLTFYFATGRLISILLYFSVGFAYNSAMVGTFPSALMFYLFLLSFIAYSRGYSLLSGLLLGIGALTHSKGPYLLILLAITYFLATQTNKIKGFFPAYFINLKAGSFINQPFDALLSLTPFPYVYALLVSGVPAVAWTIVFFIFSLTDLRGFWYLGLAVPLVLPKFLLTLNFKQRYAWLAVICAFFIFSIIYWQYEYAIFFRELTPLGTMKNWIIG